MNTTQQAELLATLTARYGDAELAQAALTMILAELDK